VDTSRLTVAEVAAEIMGLVAKMKKIKSKEMNSDVR